MQMDTKPCLDCEAPIVVFEEDTERKGAYCPPCGSERLQMAHAMQGTYGWPWAKCLKDAFRHIPTITCQVCQTDTDRWGNCECDMIDDCEPEETCGFVGGVPFHAETCTDK